MSWRVDSEVSLDPNSWDKWCFMKDAGNTLPSRPAVYEIGIGNSRAPYCAVYIGESRDVNLRARAQYGNLNKESNFSETALIRHAEAGGYAVWIRVSKEPEAGRNIPDIISLLAKFDYPWNLKKNRQLEFLGVDMNEVLKWNLKLCGFRGKLLDSDTLNLSAKPVRITYTKSRRYRWKSCGCQGQLKHRATCSTYPNVKFTEGEFEEDIRP
jgi:hypothetical protein